MADGAVRGQRIPWRAVDADGDLRTPGGLVVPASALSWTFSRSGGPGGQHVNTTSSKVTLAIPTAAIVGRPSAVERVRSALGAELRITSQESRSQWRNRQLCLERATDMIDSAARPPRAARRHTRPSRGANERRLDAKRRESEKKRRRQGDW